MLTITVTGAAFPTFRMWLQIFLRGRTANKVNTWHARPGPVLECEVRRAAAAAISVAAPVLEEIAAAVTCDNPRVSHGSQDMAVYLKDTPASLKIMNRDKACEQPYSAMHRYQHFIKGFCCLSMPD